MEKYKVAAGLPRFVDHGHIVVYRVANFVGGCGFDELPNSTAHGGTVGNNKESGTVCAGDGGDKLLPFGAKNNTVVRSFRPNSHPVYTAHRTMTVHLARCITSARTAVC